MVYQFIGISDRTVTITDEALAFELVDALEDMEDVSCFDPASNGADTVYRSPEEEESDRCYTAWGYR